jgi:hypothetical protein
MTADNSGRAVKLIIQRLHGKYAPRYVGGKGPLKVVEATLLGHMSLEMTDLQAVHQRVSLLAT